MKRVSRVLLLCGGFALCVDGVAAGQTHRMEVRELPDLDVRVDMRAIDAALDSGGWRGEERRYMEALLIDSAAGDVNGTLRPGQGVAVKFPVKRDKQTSPTEVHQYEFTFSYTPATQVVRGGLQHQDSTGRWVTPVSDLYGSGGSLEFSGGLPAQGTAAVDWYFFAHDTDADGTTPPPTLRYSAGIKRLDPPTTPPPPTKWTASGVGDMYLSIPADVLRFRGRGYYSGSGTSNFIVWCGDYYDEDDRGALLINEILRNNSGTWYTVSNTRNYNGRGQPCGRLTIEKSENIRWEFEQLSSR